MKQTVGILTALMMAMLMVSGFIVAGSTQQSRLLSQREEELRLAQAAISELETEGEKWKREAQRSAKLCAELTEQRDALSVQLGDAILSSQEANDAVAQQVLTVEEQAKELLRMETEYTQLYLDYQELKKEQDEPAPLPTLPPVIKPSQRGPRQ